MADEILLSLPKLKSLAEFLQAWYYYNQNLVWEQFLTAPPHSAVVFLYQYSLAM